MSLNINWEKLLLVQKELVTSKGLEDETEVTFLMMLANGKAKKSVIKFKDFLRFFWAVSDNNEMRVTTLVVQDQEGRTLYRHTQLNAGHEEIPDGGNTVTIQRWAALTSEEKRIYMRLLIAQINGYAR
jgi:hypothetical protein